MAQALSYSADIHSARMRALTYLLSLKRSTLRAVTTVATMDLRATDLLNILFYSCLMLSRDYHVVVVIIIFRSHFMELACFDEGRCTVGAQ